MFRRRGLAARGRACVNPTSLLNFATSRLGLSLLCVVALGLAVWGALAWHSARSEAAVEAAVTTALTKQSAEWQKSFASMQSTAAIWKQRSQQAGTDLADLRRQTHEDELRRIGADADAVRLRGPGLAAASAGCRRIDDPRTRAAASGPGAPATGPDAPGPGLLERDRGGGFAPEFAVVPWGWLVRRAEEHDALLSEAGTWRRHDAEQRALLQGARAELMRRLEAMRPNFGAQSAQDDRGSGQ